MVASALRFMKSEPSPSRTTTCSIRESPSASGKTGPYRGGKSHRVEQVEVVFAVGDGGELAAGGRAHRHDRDIGRHVNDGAQGVDASHDPTSGARKPQKSRSTTTGRRVISAWRPASWTVASQSAGLWTRSSRSTGMFAARKIPVHVRLSHGSSSCTPPGRLECWRR